MNLLYLFLIVLGAMAVLWVVWEIRNAPTINDDFAENKPDEEILKRHILNQYKMEREGSVQ